MNSKELKNIRIGSADIYVTKWTGTVPENSEIEKDENMIGQHKKRCNVQLFGRMGYRRI